MPFIIKILITLWDFFGYQDSKFRNMRYKKFRKALSFRY